MADVYRRVGGRKLTKIIAMHREVQGELDKVAKARAGRAAAVLAEHRHDGHSRITTDTGKVDRYVTLDDNRGLKAAMSIEYGRAIKDESGKVIGRTKPVWALHDAFGLHHRE